jgi:hypothetical protein
MISFDSTNRVGVEAELAYRRESLRADYSHNRSGAVRRILNRVSELLHSA